MSKIDFLEEQISEVERNIIKELAGEYAQNCLEDSIGDYTMYKLRGYFFMRSELENKLQEEVEEGHGKEED